MLILTRRRSETIEIQVGEIVVTVKVVEIRAGSVRIGMEGPPEAKILRGELADAERVEEIRLEGERVALEEGRL